ncbi:MAG: nuclear transport factor 2 family protein [Betaproteobacteria bacterium]|nr:nuclear transport factor 2 family protein [Betaproteobacteria bacterium]
MPALAAPLALAAALLVSACGTAPRATGEAHASLVAAERAFARDALDAGVRAAFLRHFATGGLLFVPAPARVEDVFARPPADPHAALLEWEPVASGVAASGDFGYTTGPARFSRRDGSSPVRHSTFFSVWKRGDGQPWRVVIDAGVTSPAPVAHERLAPSPVVRAAAPGVDASLEALLAGERGARWTREDFLARLAPDALAQRSGEWHAAGAPAIAAAWPAHEESLQPIGGDMARSGDLAYTYGTTKSAAGGGHYLHLWTRDATGRAWRIAAALRLP